MSIAAEGPNAAQIEYWNGKAGDTWAEFQERMDKNLAPMSETLLRAAALKPGERVLDIGCGCGATSLGAAEAVGPGGAVTGLDISEPMLALARKRGAAMPQLDWSLADAATARFESTHDAVISRFGVMFFADPTAAFTNIIRALKPGGRLAFVCWQDLRKNEWIALPMRAAMKHLPEQPPADPYAPGPGAFAEEARTIAILRDAGFTDVKMEPFTAIFPLGRDLDDAVLQTKTIGPLARLLVEVPKEQAKRALGAVREALEPRLTKEGVMLEAQYWLATGKRPTA
ncbi:MAG: methyltransferase domain-containing protein [Alphaproteobacteria bacterium]|nr:methyltransferase domain-containing protein [Alphaproteobacteria bacterium]